MNPKFFYLYIIAGTLALLLLLWQLFTYWNSLSPTGVILNAIPMIIFYYLAYKTYHEKKDSELM